MKEMLWEGLKAFGPAFIAWGLAVLTAKKNANSEREKILEQLEKTKENNIEAQNKSYKLQFCLSELEKKDRLYEELISDINIVIESVYRFRTPSLNEENIMVITSANSALEQLHTVMFNAGTLMSLVKATKSDLKEYQSIMNSLQENGTEVERTLHFLITGINQPISSEKFDANYNQQVLIQFEKDLIGIQQFIMKIIMNLFREMD
ncbi:hypothetical protein H9564_02310 [Limosilactobacillus sp. Sa3CUN2]|uniref:Uncharacterized protein n=1 Tax=Limosilactobacillus avistercoris TaxID=2762243 RepID=A0ABR8PBC0_9LACO|nr:hypothetical protein [Limosilactobacillus avistercoris]MBD7894565.1 hypothetical protein [Limosilactobacillus avistercoris]